jgi:hypothetical protein
MRLPSHETGFDLANSLNPARYRDMAGFDHRNDEDLGSRTEFA